MNSAAQVVGDLPYYYRTNLAGNQVEAKPCKCGCGQVPDIAGAEFVYGHKNPWLAANGFRIPNSRYAQKWFIAKRSEDRPGMMMYFCKEEGKYGHWVYMELFAMRFGTMQKARDYADRFDYRGVSLQCITIKL